MKVAAHKEKEKNRKMGKREAGEKRKQPTDFNEAACRPSAVVQEAAREKMVYARGVPRVTETLGKAMSHFDPTQTGSRTLLPL